MGTPPISLVPYQLFPIHTPGAITRHLPYGDPTVEQYYHKALEDGRFLEASIGDANNWLLQKKNAIIHEIAVYTNMNQLAVDGQLGHHARVPKYIADSIHLLQVVSQFQRDLGKTIAAVVQNIALLLTMKNSMLSMVQNNSNALANLLNNICNWGLPKLPSIPNLIADGMFNWNGYTFSPLQAFAKVIGKPPSFNFNFSFSQCNLLSLGGNNLIYPTSLSTYSGLNYNPSNLFIPPLAGEVSPQVFPPDYATTLQGITTTPIYNFNTFNSNSSMLGAVPDPHTIISAYQFPPATYQNNIVSIVPQLRNNTVFTTDPDYADPNLTVRSANLRKALVHYVSLEQVVASGYDPWVTSAWLFYLNLARNGRGGNWLTNFQAAYTQYIAPSVTYLQATPTPWNNVLGGLGTEWQGAWDATINYQMSDVVSLNGTTYIAIVANTNVVPGTDIFTWQTPVGPANSVYQNTPAAIPLIATLQAASPTALPNILWKLSYVEASLLGYTRTATWDSSGDANYLSSFTGSDLDYQPTVLNTSQTTTEILGSGTAEFPVSCTFPTAMKTVFDQVVATATQNIANDASYQTPFARFKFVYNQFAEATIVDRFTQFWRTFAFNLNTFLAQDPYIVAQTVTYTASLDSAIDPLGNPADYNALSADASSRNRSWTQGTPLLNIPIAPVIAYSNPTPPMGAANGWVAMPTELDVNAFLSRPDIQAQTIPVQTAMLRTNLSYAGLQTFIAQATQEIDNQIANANAIIASAQQLGFEVTAQSDTTVVPAAATIPVQFDLTNFDLTGNVTNPTTFTIQAAGQYAGYGTLNWDVAASGLTVTIIQNGSPIYTTTTSSAESASLPFSFTGSFAKGDVVQVVASQSVSASQNILPSSFFSMIQSSPTATTPVPVNTTDDTVNFTADVPIVAGSVVQIQPNGRVAPLDLFVPVISNIQITAPGTITVTVNAHYFVGGDIIAFSGSGLSVINHQAATVTAITPTTITASFFPTDTNYPFSNYGPASNTGNVNLMDQSGVVVQFPLPDGVVTTSTIAGGTAPTGLTYGGEYTVTGASFVTGGLIFAGMGGILTQNYDAVTAAPLSITATAGSGTVLTVTAATSVNLTGASVLLYGTAEGFLNGQTVIVTGMTGTAPSYTGFTATFVSSLFTNVSDTGTADPAVDYLICVGRAATPTEMIYEPHIPTLVAP